MNVYVHAFAAMGTVVSFRVVGGSDTAAFRKHREQLIESAVGWFRNVEEVCNRFDSGSELSRLSAKAGTPVLVSPLLYRATEFALALADETEGAFDPTVGLRMEAKGFDRSYRTGESVRSTIPPDESVSYRNLRLDPEHQTVMLTRPLLLDLGAVAKGLAIDLAAQALSPLENFSIDAGGDLYLAGHDEHAEPWVVGIRNPREPDRVIEAFRVSDAAVCTSGDYERRNAEGEHHILDARTGASPSMVASVSVIAPSAMVADGIGTAAMVLGAEEGAALIESQNVTGLFFSPMLERFATSGMNRYPAANFQLADSRA